MELFLMLLGVVVIPIVIVWFLPRDRSFFEHGAVQGFGLGVYLMLVAVLFLEAIEEGSVVGGVVWLILGIIVSLIIGILFKEFHHHHSEEEKLERHSHASTGRILVSDFFHNIVDGVAIIAGFAVSPTVGAMSFLGVLGHQIIQQTGQHILLVENGIQTKKAIFISLLTALSIFIGFALRKMEVEAILLAFSAGIIAWKVWADLIHIKWDKKIITGFVTGALILTLILLSIPHAS